MERLFNYIKYMAIFLIFELLISFIASIFNLIGIQSGITQLILLISNIILFFIISYKNATCLRKNGIAEGLIIGSLLIILMIILKILLFGNNFTITTLLYYCILIFTSIIGSLIGVNKKNDK